MVAVHLLISRIKLNGIPLKTFPTSPEKSWGPLHWAASNGHLAVTESLLKHPDSLSLMRAKAVDGATPADLARQHGYDDIAQIIESEMRRAEPVVDLGTLDGSNSAEVHGSNKLRVTSMLVVPRFRYKANLSTVIAADGLIKRDVFCKYRVVKKYDLYMC